MRYLSGEEEKEAITYFEEAAKVGLSSKCLRAKCGSVIVKDKEIVGKGYNSPPGDVSLEKCLKDELPLDFVSDRTCCIHAEQRAIMEALRRNPERINGSRLYFIRLDERGKPARAGKPYCTVCSKMALDAGISEFVLWHEEGICVYEAGEYNKISFQFRK